MGPRLVLVALAVAVVSAAGVARADAPKPWAAGVSAADQKAALALYQQGNGYFAQDDYAHALDEYEQALTRWKHPAIYYNAAVCAINLDRPVEAYQDLQQALKYGAEPIGDEHFKQGKTYQMLLADKIADVEVRVGVPNASVHLDGAPLEVGKPLTVRVGTHHIVATRDGYQPAEVERNVAPGKVNVIEIVLQPLPRATTHRLVRRWPKQVPWEVVAGGAVVALVGAPMWAWSSNRFAAYDRTITSCAGGGTYCADPGALHAAADERHRGTIDRDVGAAAFIAGGAVIAAGLGLVLLDQPHLEHVQPAIAPGRIGLVISARW